MAVPKTTETRYRDGSVRTKQGIQDYTSNPIPTSFFQLSFCRLRYEITANSTDGEDKKMQGWGYLCIVFVCPVLPAHCCPYT